MRQRPASDLRHRPPPSRIIGAALGVLALTSTPAVAATPRETPAAAAERQRIERELRHADERETVARELEAEMEHPLFRRPTELEALAAGVRPLSPEARTLLYGLIAEHIVPSTPAPLALPSKPSANAAQSRTGEVVPAPAPVEAGENPLPGGPAEKSAALETAKRQVVWDAETQSLVELGERSEAVWAREVAAVRESNARRAAAVDTVVNFLFRSGAGSVFVPFAFNQIEVDRSQKGQVHAFVQQSGERVRLNKGSVLVVAWSSPTRAKAEANPFQARARGQQVQGLLAELGIPSDLVVPPTGSEFHLRLETPGYRRTGNIDSLVDREFRSIPDVLEQQGVELFVDRRLPELLVDRGLDFEETPMAASVMSEREALLQIWQDEGKSLVERLPNDPRYVAGARQLRLEQAAFDGCNAATGGNFRLLDGAQPGWAPLSVVSYSGREWYGTGDEVWTPEVRQAARVEHTRAPVAMEFYSRADLDWLAPWYISQLVGETDTLIPRDAVVAPVRPRRGPAPPAGIRVVVQRDTAAVALGKLHMSVRSPFAEIGLRAIYDLVHGKLSQYTTRLGTLEFRARIPAAITEVRRLTDAVVDARDPQNRDPDLEAAATTLLMNLQHYTLMGVHPLRVGREPIHHELEIWAASADADAWEDETASDELMRARLGVAEGTYASFTEAIQGAHPVSAFGKCVNRMLQQSGGAP